MNMEDIQAELQKFADANHLSVDVAKILDIISAGDFIVLNSAMDQSDNTTILQVLQKYRAQVSESYNAFGNLLLAMTESNAMFQEVRRMGSTELHEHYQHCNGATHDTSFLTLQEMQTLVFEDLTTSLTSAQTSGSTAKPSAAPQDGQQNPVVAAKLKQQSIQQNAGNANFQVSVPGTNGSSSVQSVLGIDIAQKPEDSLVVTKDPTKANQVQVYSINDVSTVNEDESDEEQCVLVQPEEGYEEETPEVDELEVAANDPEVQPESDQFGFEVINDPEPTEEEQDATIQQILDFCKKLGM